MNFNSSFTKFFRNWYIFPNFLTFWMVKGAPKSVPPCTRNPHGEFSNRAIFISTFCEAISKFLFFLFLTKNLKKHLQFENFLRTVFFLPGFTFQLFSLWNKNSINFYNNVLSNKNLFYTKAKQKYEKNWYTKKLISKIAKNFKNLPLLRIVYLIS